ncbi:MAG TPA: phospholipase [Lentisphaeria bacterium]|nr:MAG: hypothetical protein A2X48_02160 [Lentisphaerae bacterium GWF2_49_21]HBC88486.1 phospholipase [Lentisphaeria bacterium]
MKTKFLSAIIILGAALLLLTVLCAADKPGKNNPDADYKKIDKILLPQILAMKAGLYEAADGIKVPWRLHIPPEASENNKLPLLFFLHGAGRRGDDNVGPMDLAIEFLRPEAQKKNPCFILTPQCRQGIMWTAMNPAHTNMEAPPEPSPEMKAALSILDQVLAEFPIDKSRIYLTGQSMGGFGSWDALYRRPALFAAAVPICGGGDPSKANLFKDVPIWAWHGVNDKAVPVENTRAMIAALEKAGGKPKYSEIKAGHGSWEPAYSSAELRDWLFAQKKTK